MRISLDLSALQAAVQQMGGPIDIAPLDFKSASPPLVRKEIRVDTTPPPEIEIPEGGMELVSLDVLDTPGDLLSYQGQQVLLYIQDHSFNFEEVQRDSTKGRKVHLSFCQTLESMRAKGRFERYVITRDHSEHFQISGPTYYGKTITAMAALKVCKYCLRKINYRGYDVPGISSVFQEFSYVHFFEEHESFFPYHPHRKAGEEEGYSEDWETISRQYRESHGYRCEKCDVDAGQRPYLIHTHHINGVRSDNRQANLKALCADCHSKEPNHHHLTVSHRVRQEIGQLRHQQQVARTQGWKDVFLYGDPGLSGVLHHLESLKAPVPEVGLDIQDEHQMIVANLELAWPEAKMGIVISEEDAVAAKAQGWRIASIETARSRPGNIVSALNRVYRDG
ncbi:hypothetical protein [Vreelandella sp. GE22]